MALTAKEIKILKSIKVASENDPNNPEFPADNPKFPASETYKINVPGFSNVWLKDESTNPTGTHKDRMAWEIVVTYRDILLSKKAGQVKGRLPSMSILTSGSAGIAIQTQFQKYKLPPLKCLIDYKLSPKIKAKLAKLGAEIYETDLSAKALNYKDILALTNNNDGIDITSAEALDPTTRFYDWLSYEIINNSPDYCFIPFGTGNLYENILNINKKEVSSKNHDPRFKGDVKKLRQCNFIGATTNNPNSKADKLFSPHLPFVHYDEQWMRTYRLSGFCGPNSDVGILREEFLDKAMVWAEKNGITAEPSGLSGLALMMQMKNKLPKNKKFLVVSTGKTNVN